MQLSEAIRLGGMTTRQCTDGHLVSHQAVCALGAAAIACGLSNGNVDERLIYHSLRVRFPVLDKKLNNADCTVFDTVIGLNDVNHWSFTRISDWVESVERDLLFQEKLGLAQSAPWPFIDESPTLELPDSVMMSDREYSQV